MTDPFSVNLVNLDCSANMERTFRPCWSNANDIFKITADLVLAAFWFYMKMWQLFLWGKKNYSPFNYFEYNHLLNGALYPQRLGSSYAWAWSDQVKGWWCSGESIGHPCPNNCRKLIEIRSGQHNGLNGKLVLLALDNSPMDQAFYVLISSWATVNDLPLGRPQAGRLKILLFRAFNCGSKFQMPIGQSGPVTRITRGRAHCLMRLNQDAHQAWTTQITAITSWIHSCTRQNNRSTIREDMTVI